MHAASLPGSQGSLLSVSQADNKDPDKAGDTSPIRLRSTATSGQFKRQRILAAIDTVVLPLATCRVRPPRRGSFGRLTCQANSSDKLARTMGGTSKATIYCTP